MWALRFLSGPQAGQTAPLQEGKNIIGRSPQCSLAINNNGISKIHSEIHISNNQVIIIDMNSSNGTFVNGVKIKQKEVFPSDKLSFHNLLFDIQQLPDQQQNMIAGYPTSNHTPSGHPTNDSQNIPSRNHQTNLGMQGKAEKYIENVALPGIYKLPEITDFKWVIAGFIFCFILIVTALSTIPMLQITKASIEKESRRRALSIAKNLARTNESALLQGLTSALTTQAARLEEGVETALIISHVDGHIIAPVNKSGEYLDKPFIHKSRKEVRPTVEQIDDSTIGAAVPIEFYNSKVGEKQIAAHAVVLYNMGSLAFDDGRALSLFIQILLIAIFFGGILGFFIFKLIEHPILNINKQLDEALRDETEQISVKYQFAALLKLRDNLNSLLTRSSSGGSSGNLGDFSSDSGDKEVEAENLLSLFPCPGIAINKDNIVIATNYDFENVTGTTLEQLKQQGLDAIPDQSFQLSLLDLINRLQNRNESIVSNNLEISGTSCELKAQAITGKNNEAAYFIITILDNSYDDYQEGAA